MSNVAGNKLTANTPIVSWELFVLKAKIPDDYALPVASFVQEGALLFRLTTESGVHGWGEPSPYFSHLDDLVGKIRTHILPDIHGRTARQLFQFCGEERDRRAIPSLVVAGLSQASCDILGKELKETAAEILTGQRKARPILDVYASGGMYFENQPLENYVAEAVAARKRGFNAWKFRPPMPRGQNHAQRTANPPGFDIDSVLWICTAVRREVGERFSLMIDLGCRSNSFDETLLLCQKLEEQRFFMVEEPLPRECEAYRELKKEVGIRIAGGEWIDHPSSLGDWADLRTLDILQLDANLLGLESGRRAIELAVDRGLTFIPHNWANHINTAANLSLASTCLSVVPFFEFNITFNPVRDLLLSEPLYPTPYGSIKTPLKPGLGVSVDDAALDELTIRKIRLI